ncbi:PREDICTED: LOW QUALITY PROTEIN: olfactory receptor 10A7-like [Tinamus guttatus]|uniref:LOW QUALITY PROTEIN: olfactory receptor 10A7-like n=1 Tax=Tinamus guttatus TaxID=94827 RepID=UPI00052EF5D3|nr:PREDICTED: LOW QUALITY PROTEIN: olfactory receptor 10A7-like [Tinamus guttatus]
MGKATIALIGHKDMRMHPVEEVKPENQTIIIHFILLGFAFHGKMQLLFFTAVSIVFLATMIGNSLIAVITTIDPALHTPMYYFLKNLALVEICYSLSIVPKMLVTLLMERKVTSFTACALQLAVLYFLSLEKCFLLGAMAYDRQVAICHPLHYSTMMNRNVCVKMAIGSWLSGVPMAVGFTTWLFTLSFCGTNKFDHFFCDVSPVLKLVCANTTLFELLIFIALVVIVMIPFSLIFISYLCIIHAVLQIPSGVGQKQAFSACAAHLMVVTFFYSTVGIIHLQPKSRLSTTMKKMVSPTYTVVTPMLNPIIYSLRNQEVKQSLRRCFDRRLRMKLLAGLFFLMA